MVKIVEFQERAAERLEGFRSNAKALPSLVYARYLLAPTSGIAKRIRGMDFALRKNRQHVMHVQHRATCIDVLNLLISRMDIRSRQCLYVNPRFGIRRNIYVPEIARLLKVCERTVTRALGSLERAGYLLRTATAKGMKMFLSLKLLRELNISLMYERLSNQLKGLDKKAQYEASNKGKKPSAPKQPGQGPSIPHIPAEQPVTNPGTPKERTEESLNIGNNFLAQLRGRRKRPPPG